MQRKLPLPTKLNDIYKKPATSTHNMTIADDLIRAEIYALMEWDVNNKKPNEEFTPEEIQHAANLIQQELLKREELDANMWQVIKNCSTELIRYQGRFTRISNLNRKDQIEVLSDQFRILYNWMTQQSKKTIKLEKKLKVKFGGYSNIQLNLQQQIQEQRKDLDCLLIELNTFKRLEENEEKAIVKRISIITEEVKVQMEREKELQKRFDELQHKKWELEQLKRRESEETSISME